MSSSVGRRTSSPSSSRPRPAPSRSARAARRVGSLGAEDDLARRSRGSGSPCRAGAGQLAGRPVGDDLALRRTATRSASCSRLVEVVRRQQDRLAEAAQPADRLPGARAGRPGRSPWSARRGRSARGRRRARARGRAGGAGRPRACARGRRASPRGRRADDLVDGRAAPVVAGEEPRSRAPSGSGTSPTLQHDPDPLAPGAAAARAGSAPSTSTSPASRGGSPRGSRPWSSCPRRSGRAGRRPRPAAISKLMPRPPRAPRRTCAGRGRRSRSCRGRSRRARPGGKPAPGRPLSAAAIWRAVRLVADDDDGLAALLGSGADGFGRRARSEPLVGLGLQGPRGAPAPARSRAREGAGS